MTASAVAAPGLRRSLRPLGLLTGGHLVTDLAQGSVPALLPFLRTELHLSYTRTAAIMLAATVASSVVQPIFGHLFDTRRGEWLLVAGPAVAGLGVGGLAFAHSFAAALGCVLASSLGVAGFHPEASKFAAWLSGDRRSTAMSVFSVGGNLGVALGPLLAGLIASQFGLDGIWLLAIPGLAIAAAQLAGLAALGGATAHARVRTARAGRDRWGPV
ncbi:MAG: transporter, family, fosmidomycin resistance protein, partial [Gaiellales bacterium]|nr:transporter, family, fosmidomycin resistance protein [Gaiellales bacterium]